jgi:two-component system nitrate/nitrite response regulator NarP
MCAAPKFIPPSFVLVALVGNDPTLRSDLTDRLQSTGRFKVALAADTIEETLDGWGAANPRAMLLDLDLAGVPAAQAVTEFLAAQPSLPIIMLTGGASDEPALLEAIRVGATNSLPKGAAAADVLAAVEDALVGRASMSSGVAQRILAQQRILPPEPAEDAKPQPMPLLTAREHEVLTQLAAASPVAEIAARLKTTPAAVKIHVTAIYEKWRVRANALAAGK